MATSGTISTTNVYVDDLISTAIRRCKLTTPQLTAEMAEICRQQLFDMLSSLPNQGRLLWTIKTTLMSLTPYKKAYELPQGTLDSDTIMYRTLTRESGGTAASSAGGTAANAFDGDVDTACTQTSTDGNISYQFASATPVYVFGLMSNGTATYDLILETSSDGVTWSTLQDIASASYTDKDFTWIQITTPVSAVYIRVRETGGGTLNVRELVFATSLNEVTLARLNQDQYSQLPNKEFAGDPNSYFVERLVSSTTGQDTVTAFMWPVPNSYFNLISVWRRSYPQDVGALTDQLEVPQRWLDFIKWELTWRLSLELPPEATSMTPDEKTLYANMAQKKRNEAFDEERDNSPIYLQPKIGVYTA